MQQKESPKKRKRRTKKKAYVDDVSDATITIAITRGNGGLQRKPQRQWNGKKGATFGCFQCFMLKRVINNWANRSLISLTQKPLVYFTKDDSPKALANAVRYVLANEQRCWIKFVRVYPTKAAVPAKVPIVYQYLLDSHPNLIIEYVAMVGKFGPAIVRELSLKEHIPSTFMFMGSFGEKFEYTFTEMGGLRLITENTATYYQPTSIKVKQMRQQKFKLYLEEIKSKSDFQLLSSHQELLLPPLSKNHESKILIKKVGADGISSPGDNDNDDRYHKSAIAAIVSR